VPVPGVWQRHRPQTGISGKGGRYRGTSRPGRRILRLLLQVPDLAELRSFADDVLGSLSRGERERRTEYLATLACYLRENSSPQRAARLLHVHPNTVAYRIRRIEAITGLSMDRYADRLTTQVALEILDALGDGP